MAIPWGPILGAGASIIGSLFGGDEKETTTTVDYRAMARSAEKAGFNPLTALRNGGSAGFTTTHHPALSGADRFGAAFATLGNALMSFDARADERAALEDRLMQAQISALNRSGAAASQSFAMDVPSAAGATRVNAAGRPELGTLANPAPAYVYVKKPDGSVLAMPNPDFVADPESLLTIPLAEGADALNPSGVDPARARINQGANPKPQGNPPSVPMQMPSLAMPSGLGKEVEDWFKPWKGVFW